MRYLRVGYEILNKDNGLICRNLSEVKSNKFIKDDLI
jgi:hypothetical protein